MRMTSIASGSSGNCIYVGSDNTHLLIDTGIAYKRIEAGLNDIGLKGQDVNGILVTHEHSDHICGLGVIARKLGIPIYASEGTIAALKKNHSLGKVDDSLYQVIRSDEDVMLGDLLVKPFANTHDAAQPLGYRVEQGHRSVAVCTDLGNYSQYTVGKLQGLDAILLESNHDIRMLQVGPYPYALKQRILGDYGHLSNEASGRLLCELLHDDMKYIMLGHLSKENNLPELAYESVRLEITMGENPYDAGDFPISVAKRDVPSEVIYID
ncbi:MAG: MBL fold metallo-hydrolase [Lachnospiraceae bacterium]|nr:MBL fold metallo-hydrolase [Lachnospiraceae bacterium]